MKDILISPRYHLSDWQRLTFKQEEDWLKAIHILEDRISGRFIRWVDLLVVEKFSGFAVVALDCLFLETLHGFKVGKASCGTKKIYVSFLTSSKRVSFDESTAESFCKNVRHGILHDTETRRGWIISRREPPNAIVSKRPDGSFVLNRTRFHSALKDEFNDWLLTLRNGDVDARQNMRRRMQAVAEIHFAH